MSCAEPRKGLIIHSGAIGDCLLTLPLAAYMKQACGLSQVHLMARPEAAGFYPRRSVIDHIRPLESAPLHRLFEPRQTFALDDGDRLITVFGGYEQIVSFLGVENADFEHNLLMTVYCSHAAQITMMPMTPPEDEPVSRFYVRRLAEQAAIEPTQVDLSAVWLNALSDDVAAGRCRLAEAGVNPDAEIAILHPGSGGRHKCWHADNFVELAGALGERGMTPVFLFGPAEEERFSESLKDGFAEIAAVLSGLTLTETLQLLSAADVFIGNDSGISHLAGCLGKRTVAIFGTTNPSHYRPLGPNTTVFRATLDSFSAPCRQDVARLLKILNP